MHTNLLFLKIFPLILNYLYLQPKVNIYKIITNMILICLKYELHNIKNMYNTNYITLKTYIIQFLLFFG